MADSKLSALTPGATPVDADLFYSSQSANSVSVTALQLKNYASSGSRTIATADVNLFVSPSGNDSNSGTVSFPFATIQHAVDVATAIDYNFLWVPVITVADGTYTQTATLNLPPLINCLDGGVLLGNFTTPANVVITDCGTDYAITCSGDWFGGGFTTNGTFGGFSVTGSFGTSQLHLGGNLAHEGINIDYGAAFNFFGEQIIVNATNMSGGLCFSRGFFGADGSNVTFANAVTMGDSANSTMSGDANLAFYACDEFTFTNGSNVTMNPSSSHALTLANGALFEGDANTKVDGVQLSRANFPGGTATQYVDPWSIFQMDNIASRVFPDITIDQDPTGVSGNNAILNLNGRNSGVLNQAQIYADFNGSINVKPATGGSLNLVNVGFMSLDPGAAAGSANGGIDIHARLSGVETGAVSIVCDQLGALHLETAAGSGQGVFIQAEDDLSVENGNGIISDYLLDNSNSGYALGNTFGGFLAGIKFADNMGISWTNTGNWFDTVDTGISRNGAGIVEINNGTPGTFADLGFRTFGAIAGTITGSLPNLISQTWNNGAVNFTALEIDITATATAGVNNVVNIKAGGTQVFNIDETGAIGAASGIFGYDNSFGLDTLADSGTTSLLGFSSPGRIFWSATSNWFSGPDTGISRDAAGVVQFNNGTAGTYASWKALNGTLTGKLALAAGTTTLTPLQFTSGTNLTTATAGACEFDGKVFYQTSVASSRQVVDTEQFISLTSNYTLANQTAAQKVFNSTTNGALTVAGSTTYMYEGEYIITNTGTTSHQWQVNIGGTASFTSGTLHAMGRSGATSALTLAATSENYTVTPATLMAVTAASTSTTEQVLIRVRGILRINAAGTIIPQVGLTTATGTAATVLTNSFFRVWPVGSNTVTNIGNWS